MAGQDNTRHLECGYIKLTRKGSFNDPLKPVYVQVSTLCTLTVHQESAMCEIHLPGGGSEFVSETQGEIFEAIVELRRFQTAMIANSVMNADEKPFPPHWSPDKGK